MNMAIIFKKMIWITAISLLLALIGNTIFYFWLSSSVAFKELEKIICSQKQFKMNAVDNYGKQKIKLDYFSVNKFSWSGDKSNLSFTVTIGSHRHRVQMVKAKNQNWEVSKLDEIK
ncbi:MAG: hypothetical protein JXO48_00865 [Deltaproteobacteria bacterium]|nr:hypothetical protein [Deltaproteobacteria bacterium]